jgi:hypothetical protein
MYHYVRISTECERLNVCYYPSRCQMWLPPGSLKAPTSGQTSAKQDMPMSLSSHPWNWSEKALLPLPRVWADNAITKQAQTLNDLLSRNPSYHYNARKISNPLYPARESTVFPIQDQNYCAQKSNTEALQMRRSKIRCQCWKFRSSAVRRIGKK